MDKQGVRWRGPLKGTDKVGWRVRRTPKAKPDKPIGKAAWMRDHYREELWTTSLYFE